MSLRRIIWHWDAGISLLIFFLVVIFFPTYISNEFAKDIYSISIQILSILFSLFFASLAIIISSSNDDFIEFLNNADGFYILLINTFRFVLLMLFIALMVSIIIYAVTALLISNNIESQHKILLSFCLLLFTYGLTSTFSSALDAIKYAIYRSQYISSRKDKI